MITEIFLAIIAITLILLAIVLIKISVQTQKSVRLLQADLHKNSIELTSLLETLNDFVRSDLHTVSQETTQLIGNFNQLSSNLGDKFHALNFLIKSFGFLKSKISPGSSSAESVSKVETAHQFIKWVASSAFLFKTTREFIKRHEK